MTRHVTPAALALVLAFSLFASSHARQAPAGQVGQINVGGTPRISDADGRRPYRECPTAGRI